MNKKYFLGAVVCVCAGFLFTGCDKDDDNGSESSVISGIQAKVENGTDYNSEIDVVKALTNTEEAYDPKTGQYLDYWVGYEVASGSYTNGGFTLNLPATLDAKYLDTFYGTDEVPVGVKISDANLKIAFINWILAYKSGVEIGNFVYANQNYYEDGEEDGGMGAYFVYSDRDASITGSETEKYYDKTWTGTYNLSFKQGWNKMYFKISDTEKSNTWEWTSKEPNGLKWYFKEYYSYNKSPYSPTMASAKTVGVGKQKLFSSLKTK